MVVMGIRVCVVFQDCFRHGSFPLLDHTAGDQIHLGFGTGEVQAEEVKETVKKAAKKVAAKAEDTAEKAVKTVKKAAAKKTATKTTKKADLKTEFFLQFSGKEYTEKEILKKVKDVWTKDLKNKVGDMKDVKIYLKPEESAAYYVVNGDTTGKIDL